MYTHIQLVPSPWLYIPLKRTFKQHIHLRFQDLDRSSIRFDLQIGFFASTDSRRVFDVSTVERCYRCVPRTAPQMSFKMFAAIVVYYHMCVFIYILYIYIIMYICCSPVMGFWRARLSVYSATFALINIVVSAGVAISRRDCVRLALIQMIEMLSHFRWTHCYACSYVVSSRFVRSVRHRSSVHHLRSTRLL